MIRKTIEISTPGTRISLVGRQIIISRPDQENVTRPIEDIGVLIVDDIRITYTQAVLLGLFQAGATVIVCGRDHLPAGMMLPLNGYHFQTERHHAQINASEPIRKRLWQSLVMSKIRQQAAVLVHFTGESAGLEDMALRVRSGDPDNREAQAAQRYWPRLFGQEFKRDRGAEGVNALLNYGYAVVRAAVARAVVAAGLIPSLGVYHKNRSNPFCLADDLIEPYRPFVDWRVKDLVNGSDECPSLDDKATRGALLALFNEGVLVGDRKLPMLGAIEASATSLCRALTGGERVLALPRGMPLAREGDPEKEDA